MDLIVSTMNDLPGYTIDEVLGEVTGLTVRSRNVGTQLGAGFKSLVGGELKGLTKQLLETREQARERMCEAAEAVGANAVIAMRFDSDEVGQGYQELVAYGTAVQRHEVVTARATAAPRGRARDRPHDGRVGPVRHAPARRPRRRRREGRVAERRHRTRPRARTSTRAWARCSSAATETSAASCSTSSTDAGRRTLKALTDRADVFVTNMRPDAIAKCGADADTLRAGQPCARPLHGPRLRFRRSVRGSSRLRRHRAGGVRTRGAAGVDGG